MHNQPVFRTTKKVCVKIEGLNRKNRMMITRPPPQDIRLSPAKCQPFQGAITYKNGTNPTKLRRMPDEVNDVFTGAHDGHSRMVSFLLPTLQGPFRALLLDQQRTYECSWLTSYSHSTGGLAGGQSQTARWWLYTSTMGSSTRWIISGGSGAGCREMTSNRGS